MIDHSISQNDLPADVQILNISVNMARIANWVKGLFDLKKDKGEEVYRSRLNLIRQMIAQTESYLNDLTPQNTSSRFRLTLDRFKQEFKKMNYFAAELTEYPTESSSVNHSSPQQVFDSEVVQTRGAVRYSGSRIKKLKVTAENHLFTDRGASFWAEKALTWANILQHRAKLA